MLEVLSDTVTSPDVPPPDKPVPAVTAVISPGFGAAHLMPGVVVESTTSTCPLLPTGRRATVSSAVPTSKSPLASIRVPDTALATIVAASDAEVAALVAEVAAAVAEAAALVALLAEAVALVAEDVALVAALVADVAEAAADVAELDALVAADDAEFAVAV